MKIRFIKLTMCNQWRTKELDEYGINFINAGFNREAMYAQGDEYTIGVAILGFACGINFMIMHKAT